VIWPQKGSREEFKSQLHQTLFLNPCQLRKKRSLFDTADDFTDYFPMLSHEINADQSLFCDQGGGWAETSTLTPISSI